MTGTQLVSRASEGLHGPLSDLAAFARELLRPTLVTRATLDAATVTAFPGLIGVLPGVGRFDPLDWGLGFELRDAKDTALDGPPELPGDVRAFRRVRRIPVGRSGAGSGARLPHRSRLRPVGAGGVAAVLRRRHRRR